MKHYISACSQTVICLALCVVLFIRCDSDNTTSKNTKKSFDKQSETETRETEVTEEVKIKNTFGSIKVSKVIASDFHLYDYEVPNMSDLTMTSNTIKLRNRVLISFGEDYVSTQDRDSRIIYESGRDEYGWRKHWEPINDQQYGLVWYLDCNHENKAYTLVRTPEELIIVNLDDQLAVAYHFEEE